MFTQAQFLSSEEQQIIHDESIRILEEVGALFHSKIALGILEKMEPGWIMKATEQIVVDDEIACFCKRIRDGIDMSEAKNYFDDIKDVKPGGHFLTQMNTIKACRSEEFFAPSLCDRGAFETWDELGRPDI